MSGKFEYKALGQLVNINTISPNGKFYYRIRTPYSINMSNFGSSIAFYKINNELLYHRSDCVAHWLEPCKVIEFVKWSRQGNLAYFYEYKRNEVYNIVFLDLGQIVSYRLDIENKLEYEFFKLLNLSDREFDEEEIKNILLNKGIQPSEFYKDKIIIPTILEMIFKKTKWHPSI